MKKPQPIGLHSKSREPNGLPSKNKPFSHPKPKPIPRPAPKDPLTLWNQAVAKCDACPLHALNDRRITYRYSHGPYSYGKPVDILFVGEGPGDAEYILREPFKGPAGQELNELLTILPDSVRYLITNAVLCTPWIDDSLRTIGTPSLPEIKACGNNLRKLIAITKPTVVVALGKVAERSLKKIYGEPFRTLAHPSFILRSDKHQDYERQRFSVALQEIYETKCLRQD